MSSWREIRYYAKGTPTKTTIRLRRRHLFTEFDYIVGAGACKSSPCGLQVFDSQLVSSPAPKCGNCLKSIRSRKKKRGN